MGNWDLRKQQAKIEFKEWIIINKQNNFTKLLNRIKEWLNKVN
jgi:hypothetical protein